MKKIISALALVGLLTAVVAARPGNAASAPPAAQPQTMAVGVVDLGRLNAEYQSIQQLNGDFQTFQMQQQAKLEERMKTRLLSDAEQREYLDVSTVGAPTEANQRRMEELATLSEKREPRLDELNKKPARTPEEQKEFDALNQIYRARAEELAKLQGDLQQAALAKRDELMKIIENRVDTAIQAVAGQKKLSLVLAKEAVRYGGVDITDDVLTKLNATPSPKSAAAAAPAK